MDAGLLLKSVSTRPPNEHSLVRRTIGALFMVAISDVSECPKLTPVLLQSR